MGEYLSFRKHYTPGIIHVLFWVLLLANTLGHLAQTHQAAGDATAARAAWLRALDVYEDLRHRDAAKVRRRIQELDALIALPVG